jgi:hypothetical protein
MRHRLSFKTIVALVVLAAHVAAAGAQDIQAGTATVVAPLQLTVAPASAFPPPDAMAEGDLRDGDLGDHHREGPPLEPLTTPPLVPPAPSAAAVTVAPGNVALITNQALDDSVTNNVTSQVGEPSVGVRGAEILYTGNWYSAFSSNGGASFSYRNPSTTFPSVDGGFCCDQVALYDEPHDLMIWFLQYIEAGGANTARVAVAQGADIAAEQWRYYDFTPQGVGNWANEWFDYPDLATGDDFLYVTTNAFSPAGSFTRAVVLRLPLADLAAYQGFTYNFFDTTQFGSLRPTLGATDTMYFGTHLSLAAMHIFTWPENSTTISATDVPVEPWSNGARSAPGPDGRDWLGRVDRRVTGAWASGGQIGFGWTASQDGNYPRPHVRVAVMDAATKAIVAEPHIWNANTAFAYPAFAPNSAGTVGVSVAQGGGADHPNTVVGYLEDAASNDWRLSVSTSGTDDPDRNVWGDYYALRAHPTVAETWVGSGFTQQGGAARTDIEPTYVHFGEPGGPPPPVVSLVNTDPGRTLRSGDTVVFRATVTQGGSPLPGVTVGFTSSDTALATVVSNALTDASGVASATVTGGGGSGTAQITAVFSTASDSKPVKVQQRVPDVSALGFAALLLLLIVVGLRHSRLEVF